MDAVILPAEIGRERINMINAIMALAIIGGCLGLMLGVANKYLKVEVDERIDVVTGKLPGVNCGGCGFAGCNALATALVNGEIDTVSKCVVANSIAKGEIANYLNTTPGPDGNTLKVKP